MRFLITLLGRRLVGLAALLLLGGAAAAQAPAWQPVTLALPAVVYSISRVTATVADASGNVYVGGYFSGSITLGGVTLTSVADGEDIFVAKWLPATRTFAWVQRGGGPGDERITALALSGGNVYATGYFYNTATFGTTTFTSAGASDVFVAKLTDAGSSATFAWAQRAGGPADDRASGVAVSGAAVYVVGSLTGTAAFGSSTYTSAGSTDGFVTRLTEAGGSAAFTWTQTLGSTSIDYLSGVAVAGNSVYFTGSFRGTVAFGPFSLASGSVAGLVVAKLTDAGPSATYNWVQQGAASTYLIPGSLVVQGTQVYVAGSFYGTGTFGSTSLPNASSSTQSGDIFVAKLTDTGPAATYVWALAAGGSYSDELSALAVQGNRVYLGGLFESTTSFGGTTLADHANLATSDAYVACLTDAGPSASFSWAVGAGGTAGDQAVALTTVGTTVYVGGWITGLATFGSQTVGAVRNGNCAFLTSLVDATGLATTGATAAPPRLALFPTPTPHGTLATVQVPEASGLATSGAATVGFTVLDAVGRVVRARTAALPIGTTTATLDVTGLAPGVYALRVAVGESVGTARLVVE